MALVLFVHQAIPFEMMTMADDVIKASTLAAPVAAADEKRVWTILSAALRTPLLDGAASRDAQTALAKQIVTVVS